MATKSLLEMKSVQVVTFKTSSRTLFSTLESILFLFYSDQRPPRYSFSVFHTLSFEFDTLCTQSSDIGATDSLFSLQIS